MPSRPLHILLVEDNPADARLFEMLFVAHDGGKVRIERAETLGAALGLLGRAPGAPTFDLILLDLTLPDSESLDTLRAVRGCAPAIPIVVLSGLADETIALRAVREGAQDYLVKGSIDAQLLSRAARYAIERISAQADRDRARDALAVSEERLRLVAEASTDGIWDWNMTTGEVFWSDRVFELLGVSRSGVRNFETTLDLIHPDDRLPFQEAIDLALAPGGPKLSAEVRLRRAPDRYGYFRISGKVVRDGAGGAVRIAGSIADITERRQAEQALRDSDEQLRQSQKMEAVGQLASGVAHDFNNLLTAIRGYASLARHTLSEAHPALESLDQVEEASRQATGVAGALLTFARRTHTEKSPVNMAQTVESATRLFRRTLPPSVRLVVKTQDAEDLWVLADSTQLQQVIINLALNAKDAIGALASDGRAEGTLSISARPERLPRTLFLGPRPKPGAAHIIVRDTGIGMTPQVMARIFEPFFTTKPRGDGTGLGLAVIHGIVQDHAGSISVDSKPGAGSVFTVSLPLVKSPAATIEARPIEPGALAGGLALLAADNQLVRALLASMLAALGYEVAQASSAERALSAAANIDLPIDLLVVDQGPSGQEGMALLARLRDQGRIARAVIVAPSSAPGVPPDRNVVMLRKPFQLADLRRAIAALASPERAEATA